MNLWRIAEGHAALSRSASAKPPALPEVADFHPVGDSERLERPAAAH
jgi:hypothetical protein